MIEYLRAKKHSNLRDSDPEKYDRLVAESEAVADTYRQEGIVAFKAAGVSHFILSGWPKWDAMLDFGREVLPRIRQYEQTASTQPHTA